MEREKLNEQEFNTIMAGGTRPRVKAMSRSRNSLLRPCRLPLQRPLSRPKLLNLQRPLSLPNRPKRPSRCRRPLHRKRRMHRTRRTDLIQMERSEVSWRKILTRSHGPAQTITPPAARCSSSAWSCSRGDVSGEHAVCLTFKNISKVTLTALEIHFKCKGVDGVILCETGSSTVTWK